MKNENASDYKSYITVQDLFYPEYLQVSAPPAEYDDNNNNNINITPTVVAIDETDINNGNGRHHRWGIVWAEATLLNDTKSINGKNDATAPLEPSIVVPSPSPVSTTPNIVIETPILGGGDPNTTNSSNTATSTTANTNNNNNNNNHTVDAPYYHGNLMEVLIGVTFALAAIATTLAIEISTMIVYIIATTMYTMAKKFQHNHSLILGFALHICALVFIICAYALILVDVTLFICSVIIAEVFAITAGMLTSFFSCGNVNSGMTWHQYIRKICHLSRWALRDIYPSIDKEPKRMFPIRNKQNGVNKTTPNNNNTTTADPTKLVSKE